MLDATLNGLASLRATNAHPLSQGLSPENAQACMKQAMRPLNEHSLRTAMEIAGTLPKSIGIVVPHGVFTTPIEWVALALAGGARVHIKAPERDPSLVRVMVEQFAAEGLPVSFDTSKSLPPMDAIVAFGGDATIASIEQTHADVPVVGYGHKFSVAFAGGDMEQAARCIALDVARYDTRGCMAPTAVFTTCNPVRLGELLATEMMQCESRWPRGVVDPALGPEWRRRVGLARVVGQVWTGANWAVTTTPSSTFTATALPRLVEIHAVESVESFEVFFQPWRRWLSTCGTDIPGHHPAGFHRVCALGWMQAPPFPRNHDGRPMLSGLHGPPGGSNA